MGLYDTLPNGSQIKCWDNDMKTFHFGDEVPQVGGNVSYIVLLREGGYIHVSDGWIIELVEDGVNRFPEDFPGEPCCDKWGDFHRDRASLKKVGLLGEDYYYRGE